MKLRAFLIAVVLAVSWRTCLQEEGKDEKFPCHSLSRDNYTCAQCIQFHTSCAWCKKPDFDEKHSRCDSFARLSEFGCGHEGDYENPQTEFQIHGKRLRTEDDPTKPVHERQLYPERIEIKLRPMDKKKFNIVFKQLKNYPVDLYYLMDMSYSMQDDQKKLAELGDKLANRMNQITSNFRLGFGSFVDKTLVPFVDPRPERRDKPCDTCSPPYGFRHEMSLTTNTTMFKNKVSAAQISGNLDGPEGGFDAIMQSLVCPEQIGWREKSRKMIVFSTDAGFHYAGDGRLAGVVTPNDGECHLNRGLYSMSSEQDYPSISQLHQKIREARANIIFAVTHEQLPLFNRLKDALHDVSASVGELANDSQNIVELIENEYRKITDTLILVDNLNVTQGLKLKYRTSCTNRSDDLMKDTNTCDDVALNSNILFEVELEHVKCVDQKHFQIEIRAAGLSEYVAIDVTVDCDCPCAYDNTVQRYSPECSGNGDLKCGVCECLGNNVGRKCECSNMDATTSELDERCRQFPESDICSGLGTCRCGQCVCDARQGLAELISGQWCQCDNFQCPRHNGKRCNDQGKCICRQCQCNEGWTGYACDCPISNSTCMAENGKMCSGHGECVCGRCKCDDRYSGVHCDTCTTCPTKCLEYRNCVNGLVWNHGVLQDNETAKADCELVFVPIVVEELPPKYDNDTKVNCQFVCDEDDCTYYFMYDYNDELENVTVWVRKDKDCPPPVPILAIVLGLICGIVLIGLILLLVWKLLTVLHDRREYAMFEQERLMAKWDTGENPIFTPATSTFKNPLFSGGRQ